VPAELISRYWEDCFRLFNWAHGSGGARCAGAEPPELRSGLGGSLGSPRLGRARCVPIVAGKPRRKEPGTRWLASC
jgi:hypothetical protein